jgi:hypothetical protein
MADNCPIEQPLCPIYRGDTLSFQFTFTDIEGNPLSIVGKKLYFTMKLDPTSADDDPGNLQYSVIFPDNTDSQNGIGNMIIPADETQNIIPNATYYYDFQYVDGGLVATIGAGTIDVKQDITLIGD